MHLAAVYRPAVTIQTSCPVALTLSLLAMASIFTGFCLQALLTSYGFDSTITLTFLQGCVTVACLQFMKWRGIVTFPDMSWKLAKQVLPLSVVFVSYVIISLMSLGRVNVPMFTALRRLQILFTVVAEYVHFGNTPSRSIWNCILIMTLGAAIAAWKDLTFDPVRYMRRADAAACSSQQGLCRSRSCCLTPLRPTSCLHLFLPPACPPPSLQISYLFLFGTNLFTSLYTVYINVVKRDTGLNVFGMMYFNSVLTLPIVFIIAVGTGDWAAAWNFKYARDLFFQMNFQASIFMAFLMNVATFFSTTLNSARTQTVVGQLKNFVAFLLGLVLFDDYIYDPINFVGLIVGFWGGIQYSYVTYKNKEDAAMVKSLNSGAAAPALTDGGSKKGDAPNSSGSGSSGSGLGLSGSAGSGGGAGASSADDALHLLESGSGGSTSALSAGEGELRGRHGGAGATVVSPGPQAAR